MVARNLDVSDVLEGIEAVQMRGEERDWRVDGEALEGRHQMHLSGQGLTTGDETPKLAERCKGKAGRMALYRQPLEPRHIQRLQLNTSSETGNGI